MTTKFYPRPISFRCILLTVLNNLSKYSSQYRIKDFTSARKFWHYLFHTYLKYRRPTACFIAFLFNLKHFPLVSQVIFNSVLMINY